MAIATLFKLSKPIEIMKSISQLANELGYSHTSVANKIQELEIELGRTLGTIQGRAKMLDLDEQALIRERLPQKTPKPGSLAIRQTTNITRLDAPALPIIPEIVEQQVDTSYLDAHNSALDDLDEQLDSALKNTILNLAKRDASTLKPQLKAIYKSALVEAKAETLADLQK